MPAFGCHSRLMLQNFEVVRVDFEKPLRKVAVMIKFRVLSVELL